ncbi:MAG TPA: glycoside hydrolase family 2 TIM barrel-domain containing protein [Tepidisphaeraceae bacterium]|nr:glycoside hydrolase family 2 TIM barrel-domain containing protein [Tepidisphaeraceae bacterium]
MRLALVLVILLGAVAGPALAASVALADNGRTTQSFDADWRFFKGDASGADQPAFDDSTWRSLSVPHDWSIEGPFDQKNPTGPAGACLPAGIGWYRKHFILPANGAGRRVFINFDGVMANSDVWINGILLGHRPYGYVSFQYELTDHLNTGDGASNVIAVRADNAQQPASRWYAGAGIYRHVHLVVTDAVHIDHWGTTVTTPRVGKIDADVHVRSHVVNQSSAARGVSVQVNLVDADGKTVATVESSPQMIDAGKAVDVEQDLNRLKLRLWDLDEPYLYRAMASVRDGGATIDEDAAAFGVRSAEFNADTGFWLNGKNIKLKGVCLHGDAGGLGVAVPISAWRRRLQSLKDVGCNAIRTAHNPPAPEFLDLCDQMGFLVMDEMFDCWTVPKNPYDYHLYFKDWSLIDTRDTVRRDRNHPCIVLYSAGNEIHDTPHAEIAKPILASLIDVFHKEDPTRPVTQALFRPNVSHDYDNGLADMLDVVGQNYRENEIVAAHEQKPTRKIVGTENAKDLKAWAAVRDHAFHSGQFIWTGIDYLGEGRRWPRIGNPSGLFDTTGNAYSIAFERRSWWTDKPTVLIARDEGNVPTGAMAGEPQTRRVERLDWTPKNTEPHVERVVVYSNGDSVELSLNGKSLGAQDRPRDESPRAWQVNYEPGTIKAVATMRGKWEATQEWRTAGKPARIALKAEIEKFTPSWDDVSYVIANVVDDQGTIVPSADDRIAFKIDGPGAIAAVDNGDLTSHEPFQASERHAYHGRCVAVVRATAATGQITLTASAAGLQPSSCTLNVAPE